MTVESPFEILELAEGATLELTVVRMEEGPITIHPAGREARVVTAMRLYVPPGAKQTPPYYYDLTATTIQPTLRAMLGPPTGSTPRRVRLVKYGSGPSGRYQAFDLGAVPAAHLAEKPARE